MRNFAETADRIAGTTKKLEKTALLADYLKSIPLDEAAVAAVFFSGRPFPLWDETTLQVGGRLLWRIVEELSGKNDADLTAAYREHGDLGAVAGAVLPDNKKRGGGPALSQVERVQRAPSEIQKAFREIATARGPSAKGPLVRKLLSEVTPLEAKYIIKILTGDLRIGLKESLVEDAIEMRLFHPIGFMLASPAESAEDALSYFQNAWAEDKYDGIRAQAHCSEDTVRIFSRTRDEITESFPELPDALAGLPQEAILDGEIVAWSYLVGEKEEPGRALPFSALQQRLGRKKVSEQLMRDVPVAYLVFDVIYAGGELLIDRPLRERRTVLDQLLAEKRKPFHHRDTGTQRKSKIEKQANLVFDPQESVAPTTDDTEATVVLPTTDNRQPTTMFPMTQIIRAPVFQVSSPGELDQLFDDAQARGNEGLMIKDAESPYTPGRRGKSWLKLKRELATLDVVVTAAEYGHGKRIGVLSDYTFAVRDGDRLLNIGKAYSGLTDAEIAEMTKWFLAHTIEDQGFRRIVEPKIVLEVAFNNIMKSDRHSSGYALRFPRIVRLRPDKLAEEADGMERVREVYENQSS